MTENKTIKTKNVEKSMESFASECHTPLSECDFKILNTETYIKTSSDDEFRQFNENIEEHYKDKSELINQHVEFRQIYTIEASRSNKVEMKLNYTLELDKFESMPKIVLHPDSHILYKTHKPKEIFLLLVREINKIKVKNSILINIFDESMIKTLKAFTKHLYGGKFKKKIRIPLFEGVEPKITKAGKLILWFNNKETKKTHQIIEVEKDEVLVEFKKPIFGKNGFNSHGNQIGMDYANNEDDLQVPIDNNSVYIQEDENKKLYKSRVKGFVHFNENLLSVDNRVKMSKLSRVENTLAKEEDNNIEVHISQNDTTKDSIGEGVELVSETIHINGHVGANSLLKAINLQIDGATHKDSKQFAKMAKINRHKGSLRCNNAKIALLEGGIVHARNVDIEASLNGIIYAQNVKIGHVKSNLKVYASESITIKLVSGEDNLFKINYKDVPILSSQANLINRDIQDLKFSLEDALRHNKSKAITIQEQIKELKSELKNIQESTLRAKISIEKPFKGLNTINFTLHNDEIVYKTDEQSYEPFYLEITEDKITLLPVGKSISLN